MAQAVTPQEGNPSRPREIPWWAQPVATVVVLGGFSLYAIWEAFTHSSGRYENYLSPFFSPDVHSWGIRVLPALYVLWVPLLFRATCYYYRKAYYRSFFWDPPACALPDGKQNYRGETRLPFIINNLHRYFLFLSFVVLAFLWKDAIDAFFFRGGFGVGLGSIIMLVDVALLTVYSLSCHALRHLVGGRLNCFSCSRGAMVRYTLWKRISEWNQRHAMWAWLSLFSVWGTDLYIRLLITGAIHDPRFIR